MATTPPAPIGPTRPQPFLKKTTEVNINSDGPWGGILTSEGLTISSDHDVHDVAISSGAGAFGILKFSSDKNNAYFGSLQLSDVDSEGSSDGIGDSNAWMGDPYGSGVLLLRAIDSSVGEFSLVAQVCSMFSVNFTASSGPLILLLNRIDPVSNRRLKATLVPLPVVDDKDPTKITPNVHSDLPTSGLWCFATEQTYETHVRLSYTITGADSLVTDAMGWIQDTFPGISPKSLHLPPVTATFTRRTTFPIQDITDQNLIKRSTAMSIAFDIPGFRLNLSVSENEYDLILLPKPGKSIVETITSAFDGLLDLDTSLLPSDEATRSDPFVSLFDHVYFWYLRILNDTTQPREQAIQWGVGLLAIWKPNNVVVVACLTYDSQSRTFVGRLMLEQDFEDTRDLRSPDWDPQLSPNSFLERENITPADIGHSLDLWAMLGFRTEDQPPIPHKLINAQVSFTRASAGNGSVFSFVADLVKEDHLPQNTGAPSGFSWTGAGLALTIVSPPTTSSTATKPSKTYAIDVYTTFTLSPREPDPVPAGQTPPIAPAFIALGLHYDTSQSGSSWLLRASAQNLSVALLRSFFDDGPASDGAMAVMSKINLRELDFLYTYRKNVASSFLITAVLTLGDLELDLSYQYVTASGDGSEKTATAVYLEENPDGGQLPKDKSQHKLKLDGTASMKFVASLRASTPQSTIASIAESIVPGAAASLPKWVGDIVVNPTTATGDSPPTAELEFSTKKDPNVPNGNNSVLTAWLSMAGFSLTFVQYKTADTANTKAILKRLIRISVDQIPLLKDIPLVGQLPQPFDNLEYMWVDDETDTPVGITRQELDTIKDQFPHDIPPLQTKQPQKVATGSNSSGPATATGQSQNPHTDPNTVLLEAGHHFIVITKGNVVLDHVFNTSRDETDEKTDGDKTDDKKVQNKTESASTNQVAKTKTPAKQQPTKGNVVAKVGPLSVSALTFDYKDGFLKVTIDASLELGPITFSVIGFEIKLDLSKVKLDHLAGIITDKLVSVSLHGIEVGVEQGGLSLKGVFLHEQTATTETYSGGITVGFNQWQVLAIGQYLIKSEENGKPGFRAVFVYGKLDGPLVQLAFATISGVRLGFGYNYAVRMPQLDELYAFPFISDHASEKSGNDPMKVLNAMIGGDKPFVYAKDGACWFTAGMTIKAFQVLTLTAVLMVDIDSGKGDPSEKGVIIALLADGVFQMEPGAEPNATLFYVEIVVSVELNFVQGYIAANAVLAPASHVYVPQARLVGGASFYSWFGSNSHAGEWVISVGGFPRGYQLPSYYPNPDRVGLNFTVGDMIQIIGTGYLAITPKCAMAGGSLHLSLSVGPVSAYADLVFDAFINFKPFHFKAFVSLSVGVECDIDILFIHIHISIHLGANLTIWGPDEFGGHAHVDFWFFGFGIDFGAREKDISHALTLKAFYEMLKAAGPQSAPPTNDSVGNDTESVQHKYSIEDGLIPAKTPKADTTNNKNDFPSTGARSEWQVKAGTMKVRIDSFFAISDAHFMSPHSTATDPKNKITLPSPKPGATAPAAPAIYSQPMHSAADNSITSTLEISVFQIDDPNNPKLQSNFRGELVLKSAPTAHWSIYDPFSDPLRVRNPGALQNTADSTRDMVLAVRILPPKPHLYESKIVDFDATAAMHATIPGSWTVPPAPAQGARFAGKYFEPEVADNDVDLQTARWEHMARAWNPRPTTDTDAKAEDDAVAALTVADLQASEEITTVPDLTALREGFVKQIASVLEWDIRPPEDMTGNTPTPSKSSDTPAPSTDGPVIAPARVENKPKVNDDGRTDWELLAAPPDQLVSDIDTYYAALPFVIGRSVVAAAA